MSSVYEMSSAGVSRWRAYFDLCKPRVVLLMLITAVVGMYLATPGLVPISVLVFGIVGIALASGAAAAVNHVMDQYIDAKMGRTKRRPLPTGRVSTLQALIFASVIGVIGLFILWFYINPLTSILSFITLMGYAIVYTVFLKHATPQNIVIGGSAGAAPPLLGWTAVTGHLDPNAFLLVLIIFAWTPPHFWALAIQRKEDYAKAGVPMLPVTHGVKFTKQCIFLYTVLLFAVSLLPFATGMSGYFYLCGAMVLNSGFLYYVVVLLLDKENRTAMKTFRYSIWYLLWIFIFLLFDHYIMYS